LKGDDQNKAVTMQRQYVSPTARDALQRLNDNSGVKEWKANRNVRGDRCRSWMDGHFLMGTFNTARRPNDSKPDVVVDGGYGGLSGLRSLEKGVNVGFCDSSARFVNANIDAKIWKALSTRAGGESTNPDDY
jgi:hypothetical protein